MRLRSTNFILLLATIVFILSIVFPAPGQGFANVRTITVPRVEVQPGSEAQISLQVDNGAGITAMQFTLEYDPKVITKIKKISAGDSLDSRFDVKWDNSKEGILRVVIMPSLQALLTLPSFRNGTGTILNLSVDLAKDLPETSAEGQGRLTFFLKDVMMANQLGDAVMCKLARGAKVQKQSAVAGEGEAKEGGEAVKGAEAAKAETPKVVHVLVLGNPTEKDKEQ